MNTYTRQTNLSSITTARIIKTSKLSLDLFVLIIAYSNGHTDVHTFLSAELAISKLKSTAPYLNESFFRVERV